MIETTYIEDRSCPESPVRYTKLKFLGKGGFGKVYEVSSSPSHSLACKIIEKSSLSNPRAKQKLINEIRIHRSLSHKNIVKFLKFFEDEENFYILLELCTLDSLSVLLRRRKRLLELEVQSYLVQILLALKYIHESKVIHRDIKLGNALISGKMEIKLADFGLSAKVEYEGERKRTICGTPNYMAPEMLNSFNGHSYEVDVWSFGVMMYTMLVGKPPFDTGDIKSTYSKIKSGFFCFPDSVQMSTQAKDLIMKILVLDPLKRITIDKIFDHPFFNKNKIPRFLPFSTLTVPLSESYQHAFNRKPLTPREFLTNSGEEEVKAQRSTSQAREQRTALNLGSEDNEYSKSSNSNLISAITSCFNMKKQKITSLYSLTPNGPSTWVHSWVDYSHKYGLAYRLSNGCIGLCFNDQTHIITDPTIEKFKYYSKTANLYESAEELPIIDPPIELSKKVKLILYLAKKLEFQSKEEFSGQPLVKKWFLTEHVVLFRLTNKVVQAYFRDQSEVFLGGLEKMVTFVNKNKEIRTISVGQVMESENKDMIKRVKFIKEVLLGSVKNKKLN